MSSSLSNSPSRSPSPVGVGLSDPVYSSRRRGMLDVINRMRNTGVQGDIDLPEIAVVGQQSAGKSSLIESISGVTLPRSSNTCTRCPTECRLSRSSSTWMCKVSLRIHVGPNGAPVKVNNIPFGDVIFDKDDVEDRLRRAQLAILSPSHSARDFLGDAYPDSPELSFSANCVVLEITGPEVEDLSFIDLPGLIASSGSDGNNNDITLIRSLAISYIKKPSCLILLTVACETDFMNQGAYELAKEMDPQGKRTVGVLTKPDRIPHGDEDIWTSLIRNEDRPLENNWFCVKQPSAQELRAGITWKQAREKESEYFSSTGHWTDLDAIYQKYLRTENLVIRLSELLSDLISKRLPAIQREINTKLDETTEQLRKLPAKPSDDPLSDIVALLHEFTNDIKDHVKGVPEENGLIQAIRPQQDEFRKRIRQTAPNFRPFERSHAEQKHLPSSKFLSMEGEEDEGSDDEEPESNPPSNKIRLTGEVIYVDDVAKSAKMAQTRELPGNHPFVVQQKLIDTFTKQWNAPAQDLCGRVHQLTLSHVNPMIKRHFTHYGDGRLEQTIHVLMQERLKGLLSQTRERVQWVHALEKRAFTLNHHYLSDYMEKFMAFFKDARKKGTLPAGLENPERDQEFEDIKRDALAMLSRIGMPPLTGLDLAKLLPADEMEPYIKIQAEVRAYFQVSYKRFVDNVPLAIDEEMLQGLQQDLLGDLCRHLGVHSPEGQRICQDFSRESPQNAGKRAELTKKLERLTTASEELLRM